MKTHQLASIMKADYCYLHGHNRWRNLHFSLFQHFNKANESGSYCQPLADSFSVDHYMFESLLLIVRFYNRKCSMMKIVAL
jgi:hypothetical protein